MSKSVSTGVSKGVSKIVVAMNLAGLEESDLGEHGDLQQPAAALPVETNKLRSSLHNSGSQVLFHHTV